MDRKLLEKRFPKRVLRQKIGPRGQTLDYVEWAEVVKRLNCVFDSHWSFEIMEWQQHAQTLIVHGRLTAGPTVKTQFGTCRVDQQLNFDDSLKAAASDALKRCAVLLGIGLHLYSSSGKKSPTTNTSETVEPPNLSERQDRLIRALAVNLEWDEVALEEYCHRQFAKNLSQLSRPEASQLINSLNRQTNRQTPDHAA